jgi:hypothetical protein
MELSNFKLTRTKGKSEIDWEFFADVDVTTGSLWWKKTVRREIRRVYGGAGSWHFVDTGEFTPGFQAEALARAWSAQTGEQT